MRSEGPDYNEWKKRVVWRIHDAILLITGHSPMPTVDNLDDFQKYIELYRGQDYINPVKRIFNDIKNELFFNTFPVARPHTELVIPSMFIKWAISSGFSVPEEFQDLAEETVQMGLSIVKPELKVNESEQAGLDHKPIPEPKTGFSCDNVTSWDQVSLKIVNDNMVQITSGGKIYNKEYGEIGLSGRGKGPSIKWEMLKFLALGNGILRTDNLPHGKRDNLKKQISQLRKVLKSMFPNIEGDPFNPWSDGKIYRTRFELYSNVIPSASQEEIPKKDGHERRRDILSVMEDETKVR